MASRHVGVSVSILSRGLLIAIVGSAAVACASREATESESTSSIQQHMYGPNAQPWRTADPPYGGVGLISTTYTACSVLCADGSPPQVEGDLGEYCGDGSAPRVVCTPAGSQCTGSLIERDVVLTAGHCFCKYNNITDITFQLPAMESEEFHAVLSTLGVAMDDCGGSYEDDSSQDLAVFRLDRPVPIDLAKPNLLRPYLGGDFRSLASNFWVGNAAMAGYGGDEGPGGGFPLLAGDILTPVETDDTNWFALGISSGSWWMKIKRGTQYGIVETHGDSGGPLVMTRSVDQRKFVVGVVKTHDGDESRFSPTWNNGDGNGTWIAQYYHDADDDGVDDNRDNCAPTNPNLPLCRDDPYRCKNTPQADSDGDGDHDAE